MWGGASHEAALIPSRAGRIWQVQSFDVEVQAGGLEQGERNQRTREKDAHPTGERSTLSLQRQERVGSSVFVLYGCGVQGVNMPIFVYFNGRFTGNRCQAFLKDGRPRDSQNQGDLRGRPLCPTNPHLFQGMAIEKN